jgi:hypothetical protein
MIFAEHTLSLYPFNDGPWQKQHTGGVPITPIAADHASPALQACNWPESQAESSAHKPWWADDTGRDASKALSAPAPLVATRAAREACTTTAASRPVQLPGAS